MTPLHPVRVLVVDDHPLLREGIAALISNHSDIQLAAEAKDGVEAIECYRRLRPDVVLMDLQMPRMNGIESIQAIRSEYPEARIAVLTTYSGDARTLIAIKSGAQGYILKNGLRKELVEAIRHLAAGKRYMPAEIAGQLIEYIDQECLTNREIAILQATALGYSNREISSRLHITEETVKGHMKLIMRKLGARNRTHAVAIGIKRGIIDALTAL